MRLSSISLVHLAVLICTADGFGLGHGRYMDSTITKSGYSSSSAAFAKISSATGIGSWSRASSELKMASGGAGDEVIIEKDFRLSAIFLSGGLLLDQIPYLQVTLGPIVTLLGILFLVQTFRLNFVCDDSTFFLQDTSKEEASIGENIVVGGENRWTYDSFVNYDFFPAGWIDEPQGPILIYFKETQTPSGKKV